MFTGIVEETGRVVAFRSGAEAWELIVAAETVPQTVAQIRAESRAARKDRCRAGA